MQMTGANSCWGCGNEITEEKSRMASPIRSLADVAELLGKLEACDTQRRI
jgi:hypothetical protein